MANQYKTNFKDMQSINATQFLNNINPQNTQFKSYSWRDHIAGFPASLSGDQSRPSTGFSTTLTQQFENSITEPTSISAQTEFECPKQNKTRNALRIIKRLEDIPDDQMTDKDKLSLTWAINYIANRDPPVRIITRKKLPKPTDIVNAPNLDSCNPTADNCKSNDSLEEQMDIVVVDKGVRGGYISHENWNKVVLKLSKNFLSIMREYPGTAPIIRDDGWYKDSIKLISCANERSMDLYKVAISRVGEIWPGAKLEVAKRHNFLRRSTAWCLIPAEPKDVVSIMDILRLSNPQLSPFKWKLSSLGKAINEQRCATFSINSESVIELQKCDGLINYGFTPIKISVYNGADKKPPLGDDDDSEAFKNKYSMAESSFATNNSTFESTSTVQNMKPTSLTQSSSARKPAIDEKSSLHTSEEVRSNRPTSSAQSSLTWKSTSDERTSWQNKEPTSSAHTFDWKSISGKNDEKTSWHPPTLQNNVPTSSAHTLDWKSIISKSEEKSLWHSSALQNNESTTSAHSFGKSDEKSLWNSGALQNNKPTSSTHTLDWKSIIRKSEEKSLWHSSALQNKEPASSDHTLYLKSIGVKRSRWNDDNSDDMVPPPPPKFFRN